MLHSSCPSCFMTPTPDSFCKAGQKKLGLGCGNHSQSAITYEDDDLYIMMRVFYFFFIFGWLVVRYYTNCIKAPRFHFRLAARSALVTITMMMLAVLGWQWNSNQRQQPAELEAEQEEKSNACHNVTHHGRHHYHRGRCHHFDHSLHHYHCIIASAMSNMVALVTVSSRPQLKKCQKLTHQMR